MVRRVALVLSGGRGQRFQVLNDPLWRDKALALLDDTPLLVHVVRNVVDVVDEVIVCVDSEERGGGYLEVLERYHLEARIVVDDKKLKAAVGGGPNVALLSGLRTVRADFCMVVPCDMPFVKSKVWDYFFGLSETGKFDVVMPMWPNGALESLIMVFKCSTVLEVLEALCQFGCSRPGDIPRAVSRALLISPLNVIETFDPMFKSFININTQEDLKKLGSQSFLGAIQNDVALVREGFMFSYLRLLRVASKLGLEGDFEWARAKFDLCKDHFERCNSFFWAAQTYQSESVTLLERAQLLSRKENSAVNRTSLEFYVKCKESLSNAVDIYSFESKVYQREGCMRLLERALADKQRVLTILSSL